MRKEGTIVKWDDVRGFGFIRSESLGQDVFLHARDFQAGGGEAPRRGQRVTFDDVLVGGKGPRAVAVQPASAPATVRREQRTSHAPTERRQRQPRDPRGHVGARTRPLARSHKAGGAAHASGTAVMFPLMLAYAALLVWAVSQRALPWWVLIASLLLNLMCFFVYWEDKSAAQQRLWRVKENTLHLWSLLGGWGGAWFAQQLLRHKSAKMSFRIGYWFTVVLHCGAVIGWLWYVPRST